MADPTPLDLPGLHPCDVPHGRPRAAFYSWRDPALACAITCGHCGQMVMAPSAEMAQALWNDAHADRDLTEAETGLPVLAEFNLAIADIQRQYLCDEGVHIIQKLEDGSYRCAQCGLGFREYHALLIETGLAGGLTP